MRRCFPDQFFLVVTARPLCTIVLVLVPLLALSAFALELRKDTRAEAYLPVGHPAVEYRQTVKRIFGLEDPMLVALISHGPDGVFTPRLLNLLSELSDRIADVPGIDPNRVTSLTSEKHLAAAPDGLAISPFLDGEIRTRKEATQVRAAVFDTPLIVGTLVTEDGQGAMIAAELDDPDEAEEVYFRLKSMVEAVSLQPTEELLVAGEGALMGNIGAYIDRDAQRLTPVVAIVVIVLLFMSYRTALGVFLPALVSSLTLGATLGLMGLADKPFFVLTNGLPVILIAIAVADSIHILGQFYAERLNDRKASRRDIVVRSMSRMWRPVTITSATTIVGFLSVHIASTSPPMVDFGMFAAFGIGVALVVSVSLVPAMLVIVPSKTPKFQTAYPTDRQDAVARSHLYRAGTYLLRRPHGVFSAATLVGLAGMLGLALLETNDSDINNFREHEPVRIAHERINDRFDGAYTLDIVVETAEAEGLLDPERLRRIEALQAFLETLPHVTATRSIVDYVKQMNRALNDGREDAYVLPASEEAVAQYFLLYSMTGDSTDFEEEIDYDYRLANIRVTLNSGEFSDEKAVMAAAEAYIAREFRADSSNATLSGRAAVHFHWMIELMSGHVKSVVLALVAVGLMAFASFRSFVGGLLALLPVSLSVLLVYAIMGTFGIWLGIGTSMSAAIAIGIGVDFAVHVIDRIRLLTREDGWPLETALALVYTSTGRALLFNFVIVAVGFGLLVVSEAPGLIRFGLLVAVAVATSFAASLFLLPALIKILRPRMFGNPKAVLPSAPSGPAGESVT